MAKIYEEISWNPHLTQECHFCKTILKYNFPFLINACLKKQYHYFPICKVRAKDVNDIPFGCHNLHRFDKRSAFVNIVRLSLKSIFWIFFSMQIYVAWRKRIAVFESPDAESSRANIADDCESLQFVWNEMSHQSFSGILENFTNTGCFIDSK